MVGFPKRAAFTSGADSWFQASPKRTPIGPSKRRRAHAYARSRAQGFVREALSSACQ
jgi:hypothetical protein